MSAYALDSMQWRSRVTQEERAIAASKKAWEALQNRKRLASAALPPGTTAQVAKARPLVVRGDGRRTVGNGHHTAGNHGRETSRESNMRSAKPACVSV